MSGEPEYYIEFRCDSCSKRLKAKPKHAGRRLKCPNCHKELRIPGTMIASASSSNLGSSPNNVVTEDQTEAKQDSVDMPKPTSNSAASITDDASVQKENKPRKSSFDVDDLQLDSMAISDLDDRKRTSDEIRIEKETKRRLQLAAEERRKQERLPMDAQVEPLSRQKIDTISEEDDYNLLPELVPSNSQSRANIESMLDAELPKLAPDPAPSKSSKTANQPPAEIWNETQPAAFYDEVIEDRYRIACPICGTVQYVTVDAQGNQVKCPDCFSQFQVPRPPANWTPSKVSRRHDQFNTNSPLQSADDVREVDKHRQQMTSEMLEKAEIDLASEKSDEDRYGVGDFDTDSFVQRTFGFFKDPVAMGFVFGYGIVFALAFALIQFGLLNHENSYFGKGSTLFCFITGPLLGVLFGLPMISAALAQLEAVANHQVKVTDWPGFDMFENIGDLLGVAMAIGMSAIPGFLVGWYLGGDAEGSGRFILAGMAFSILFLFPIFLLSILDSGNLMGLVTTDILRSMHEVKDGWAGYYFKTVIFTAIMMLLWFMLLGKSAILAGIAGATFPLMIFFLFQQVGGLADLIGEHLSFSFSKSSEESDEGKTQDLEDSV